MTRQPRPSPPLNNEQLSSRTLHPIYQAIDAQNYSKVLKLTSSSSSSSQWDIVRALRAHALQRSGKKREALLLVWEILVSHVVFEEEKEEGAVLIKKRPPAREAWSELYQRIESLSDACDVISDASSSSSNFNIGLDIQFFDCVQRLDARSHTLVLLPKGEGQASSSIGSTDTKDNNSNNNNNNSKTRKKSKGNRNNKSNKKSSAAANAACVSSMQYPPVSDSTVLQTLTVTLSAEGLYDTMSEMYSQATDVLSSTAKALVAPTINMMRITRSYWKKE